MPNFSAIFSKSCFNLSPAPAVEGPPFAVSRPDFAARLAERLTLDPPEALFDPKQFPKLGDHNLAPLMADDGLSPLMREAVAAALREAQEEVGLAPDFVTPIGYLDPYLSGTGFRILPVVATIRSGFTLTPDPSEVDLVFDVPLDFLMDPKNHARHIRELRGAWRTYHAMPYGDHYIWGVTAGILKNLYERMV